MANKRISDLPAATSTTTGDVLAIDGSTTRKITVENLQVSLLAMPYTVQHITAGGPVNIDNDAAIVRVDQAAGAAITLTLPLASDKIGPVLICDWKGDAGTNNITIDLSGTDTLPGGLTSWTIAADTGSVFLRPISGVGYVL